LSFFQYCIGEQSSNAPWLRYFNDALNDLSNNDDADGSCRQMWSRPSSDTDKLYMSVGGGDVIEVGHPTPSKISEQEDPR
jgi:hypothetical protein